MKQIECKGIFLSYDRKQVVQNLSFTVEKGDFLCIVGENGSGKSTLLKGLLGLKKPDRGTIEFEKGLTVRKMGYLPQQENGLEEFPATVKEIVQSGMLCEKPFGLFYSKEQKQRAWNMMQQLEIQQLEKMSIGELSGGQKQRVLLARAFVAAQELLLLDEPINGLDPVVASSMYHAIIEKNQKEKVTIVMVSHDVNKALDMATKILHLGNQDFFFGTPEEYKNSSLGQAFLKGVASCG